VLTVPWSFRRSHWSHRGISGIVENPSKIIKDYSRVIDNHSEALRSRRGSPWIRKHHPGVVEDHPGVLDDRLGGLMDHSGVVGVVDDHPVGRSGSLRSCRGSPWWVTAHCGVLEDHPLFVIDHPGVVEDHTEVVEDHLKIAEDHTRPGVVNFTVRNSANLFSIGIQERKFRYFCKNFAIFTNISKTFIFFACFSSILFT
jgi:hypothetical protein